MRKSDGIGWVVSLGIGASVAACSPDSTGGTGATRDTTVTDTAADTTTDTGGTGTASTGTSGTDAHQDTTPPSGPVDPACLDGEYDETLPPDSADISDLMSGYSSADVRGFVDAVLGRRYPLGQHIVQQAVVAGAASFGNCIDLFVRDTDKAEGVVGSLSTIVHECGHIFDLSKGGAKTFYRIRDDLDFKCPRAGDSYARSLINNDQYSALLPDDSYKDVYLNGDPTDNTFESGDQGFDTLLEETVQYVNSLATDWAVRDSNGPWTISARDGIRTFLWYLERYLRMARLEHPDTYATISGNKCWRDAILTVWGRAWLYLDLTEDIPDLGINDSKIRPLVLDPELLGEIQRIRDLAGCN